ncbi:hypothetical protein, partial [Methylibium sp.]|uniref:hypothetical protein n=1 Tax=Methylibium sp. TaxID=2067992 RepID=UPI0025CC6391
MPSAGYSAPRTAIWRAGQSHSLGYHSHVLDRKICAGVGHVLAQDGERPIAPGRLDLIGMLYCQRHAGIAARNGVGYALIHVPSPESG